MRLQWMKYIDVTQISSTTFLTVIVDTHLFGQYFEHTCKLLPRPVSHLYTHTRARALGNNSENSWWYHISVCKDFFLRSLTIFDLKMDCDDLVHFFFSGMLLSWYAPAFSISSFQPDSSTREHEWEKNDTKTVKAHVLSCYSNILSIRCALWSYFNLDIKY